MTNPTPAPTSSRASISLLGALLLLLGGCGDSVAGAIDRETFIETYVDLRITGLETDSMRLGNAERTEVLERHGVSAEDLTHFADVHADELEFMREVWNEIEVRLDRERDPN